MPNDVQSVVNLCRAKLDWSNKGEDDYGYPHLPLCVIDTVFSINAKYPSVTCTVDRFCAYAGIDKYFTSAVRPPAISEQMPISRMLKFYDLLGVERMAEGVYQNRQRTSTSSGILKSEAVMLFSKALCDHGANYIQDVAALRGDSGFEMGIRSIPGHYSGVSLNYFYMLAGFDDLAKVDRMIIRFLQTATGREVGMDEAQRLISQATDVLAKLYPELTVRALDHLIWQYQRDQASGADESCCW